MIPSVSQSGEPIPPSPLHSRAHAAIEMVCGCCTCACSRHHPDDLERNPRVVVGVVGGGLHDLDAVEGVDVDGTALGREGRVSLGLGGWCG